MIQIFLKRVLSFSLIPISGFLVILLTYLYNDPFRVLNDYHEFKNLEVTINRCYNGTESIIQNYENEKFDSFIFGSSRAVAFRPVKWKDHIGINTKPFVYSASLETLYGIYRKVLFIDSMDIQIKNGLVLLCLDVSFIQKKSFQGHLFIKDPRLSGDSKLAFQLEFFRAYSDPSFFFNYMSYKAVGFKPYMSGVIENNKLVIDPETNSVTLTKLDSLLELNEDLYYENRKNDLYERKGQFQDSISLISENDKRMLREIRRIFDKHKTNYRIVITPMYSQQKISSQDWSFLKNCFDESVYDFSGENDFSSDIRNFYETIHFRPFIGEKIMNAIYSKEKL